MASPRFSEPEGKKKRGPYPPRRVPGPPPPAGAGTAGPDRDRRDRTGTAGTARTGPDRAGTGPGRTGPGGTQQTPPPPKAAGEPKHHSTALKTIHCSPKLTQGHRITPNNKKKKKILSYTAQDRYQGTYEIKTINEIVLK